MKECPKCGFIDPAYWHPRIFDYEIDLCRLEDLQADLPKLAERILYHKIGETHLEDNYAYRVTKSKMVYRMWKPIFDTRGWHPKGQYYDKITAPESAAYKRAISRNSKMKNALESYLD